MNRRFLPWAFGFAPVALILLTWSDHHRLWWVKTYALPIAAVELATVGVAAVVAFRERTRPQLTPGTVCLAALFALAWVSATFAAAPTTAPMRTELWTVHVLFGFAAAYLFRADDLINGLLAGFLASVVLFGIYVATAPPHFNWIFELPGLGHPRLFGLYAATAIGLSTFIRRQFSPPASVLPQPLGGGVPATVRPLEAIGPTPTRQYAIDN